jgi:hypothetical protein
VPAAPRPQQIQKTRDVAATVALQRACCAAADAALCLFAPGAGAHSARTMRTLHRIELRRGQFYAAMLDRGSEVRLLHGTLETTPPLAWLADSLVATPECWHAGEQRTLGRSGWWQWTAQTPSVLLIGDAPRRAGWRWLRGAFAGGPIAHGESGP